MPGTLLPFGSIADTPTGMSLLREPVEKRAVTPSRARTGEMLVAENVITEAQLEEALAYQEINGGRVGASLVALGFTTEEVVARVLAKRYGVTAIDLSTAEVDLAAIKLVPQDVARKCNAVPISLHGSVLTVALASPNNLAALDELRFVTGRAVRVVVAADSQIKSALDTLYAVPQSAIDKLTEDLVAEDSTNVEVLESESEPLDLKDLERASADSSIMRLVNLILMEAAKRGASDIHIEPYENEVRIRYRIDGELGIAFCPPISSKNAVTSRLKIMAKLDISEKRRPQDGRIRIRCRDAESIKELDFRVSTLPTLFGEKIVMRLLDQANLTLSLDDLGFEPESLQMFQNAIKKPFGIILVTGPTGSGKTNTLYSAISRLNSTDTNIMTVEDPVEFALAGINQTQVHEQIGSTFASTLRAFLRQDPDVILVGEIRDTETAAIAVKASLTGHLVLTTLHTNDAASALTRLTDMGIEPFLLSTSINLICAQRLVRRICKSCKEETQVPERALLDVGFTDEEIHTLKIYRGAGCKACNQMGYKGRVGLFEVLEVTNELKQMIASGKPIPEIKRKAIEAGMITLRRSGLAKITKGLTTLDEVLAETVL